MSTAVFLLLELLRMPRSGGNEGLTCCPSSGRRTGQGKLLQALPSAALQRQQWAAIREALSTSGRPRKQQGTGRAACA